MNPRSDADRSDVEADLAAAERAGLKVVLIGRTIVLLPIGAWFGGVVGGSLDPAGFAAVGAFIAIGLLHYILIVLGLERPWHRFAVLTADAIGIATLAVLTPLSTGGDVPQILVFRAYGATFLFLLPAIAALSLSPALVLYAGFAAVGSLWGSFLWIVSGMDRTVSWADMPRGADAATYLNIFLDPDFIGTGNRIEESMAILLTTGILALAVSRARGLVRARATAERDRARVQSVFGQYVPPEAARRILDQREALAPDTRTASILFCDIEGFTRLSEQRQPAEVIAILNGFFDTATEIVTVNGGVVVSFVGDAVLAAFNTPIETPDFAERSLTAAIRLLAATEERSFEGQQLRIRIGIATGPVAAGSVGGAKRQTWTVYGDTVNVAQRLEALNKSYGTRLMVCDRTRDLAASGQPLVPLDTVTVTGRTAPIEVSTLDGETANPV